MNPYSVRPEETREAGRVASALTRSTAAAPASRARGITGWVILVGLFGTVYLLLRSQRPGPAGSAATAGHAGSTRATIVLVLLGASATWFILTIIALTWWNSRRDDKKPLIQIRLSWSASGLCFETAIDSKTIAWAGFGSFFETPELLLFERQDTVWHIVPKRAFVDEQELRQFRILASENLPLRAVPD
jgi:hypothetical protein